MIARFAGGRVESRHALDARAIDPPGGTVMSLRTLMQGPLPVTAPLVLNPLEQLGGPLMYLTGRGGLAELGMGLKDLGVLGYKIVADPSTPLWAGYAAWKKIYADLAADFGATAQKTDWSAVEHEVLGKGKA
jgi:hypothetical protein